VEGDSANRRRLPGRGSRPWLPGGGPGPPAVRFARRGQPGRQRPGRRGPRRRPPGARGL